MIAAFDAWASQFDNPPKWRPIIQHCNGHALLDGLPIPEENKITATDIEPEAVTLMFTGYACTVSIDWPYDGQPHITSLSFYHNETP